MKKFFCLVMAVAMMISMGVVSFAADSIDTEEKLQAALNAGGTVVLGDDIEVTGTITVPAGVTVTLDLNGKVLSKEVTEEISASNQLILNNGNLTIVDGSGDNSGKISYFFNGTANSAWAYAVVAISNQQATLTIKGGTIESLSTATNVYKFTIDNLTNGNGGNSVVNVEGGVITAAKGGSIRGFANSTTNTCEINISGGEILGQVWLQDPNANRNLGSLEITGGEITNNAEGVDAVYLYGLGDASGMDVSISGNAVVNGTTYLTSVDTTAPFKAEITGGTFEDSVWVCTWDANSQSTDIPAISGGTFSAGLSEGYIAEGFILDENGNVTDESSSGSSSAPSEDGSSGSSSAPSSRPSRDDDDDDDNNEGITDIVPGNKKPEGEENPNTGAPIMLPIATAVAALCGLYISKKK